MFLGGSGNAKDIEVDCKGGGPAVYHVVTLAVLDGFVLSDVEKDFLLDHIRRLSSVYFAEILGLQ